MNPRSLTTSGILLLYCISILAQQAGDVVITEYMANPQDVTNDEGEYIEVYNTRPYPVSLEGCILQDASALSVVIDQPLWIEPNQLAVLGRPLTPAADFYFPSTPPPFNLNNTGGDQISITCNGVLVAFTSYSITQQAGVARSLVAVHLHSQGQTLEAHYAPESYQFQYPGTSTTDYGSPSFAGSTQILPVRLTHFTAEPHNNGILLQWTTAGEINNSHFEIEHSTDSYLFTPIATIEGAGNSDEIQNYEYLHLSPASGENYYRLIQADYDGTTSYSEVRPASYYREEVFVYPTAADEEIHLVWEASITQQEPLAVFSLHGQQLLEATVPAGSRHYTINIAQLPGGAYYIKPLSPAYSWHKPFVKR
jgi:hypothetical protein